LIGQFSHLVPLGVGIMFVAFRPSDTLREKAKILIENTLKKVNMLGKTFVSCNTCKNVESALDVVVKHAGHV
jgi:hypothetical protein